MKIRKRLALAVLLVLSAFVGTRLGMALATQFPAQPHSTALGGSLRWQAGRDLELHQHRRTRHARCLGGPRGRRG